MVERPLKRHAVVDVKNPGTRPGRTGPATSSDALHVVERGTPLTPDVIQHEATIEDPNVSPAVEDEHAALPSRREERAAVGTQGVEFAEELIRASEQVGAS
jgi:hypothetical protein